MQNLGRRHRTNQTKDFEPKLSALECTERISSKIQNLGRRHRTNQTKYFEPKLSALECTERIG